MTNNPGIVLKLFDTLKGSSDKTDKELEKLSLTIKELIEKQTIGPTRTDLSHTLNKIQDCIDDNENVSIKYNSKIDNIESNLNSINSILNSLYSKVKIMIVTVLVVFGLMAISYVFVNNSVEDMIKKQISSIEISDKKDTDRNAVYLKLKKLLESIEESENETTNISK